MKISRNEFGSDYEKYSFGYTIWALLEQGDRLHEVYAQGFLPYSETDRPAGSFYMARSLRVRLSDFRPNSENRRVLRKYEGALSRTVLPFPSFSIDQAFLDFCRAYFQRRHGKDIVQEGKLGAILASGLITEVVVYRGPENDVAGYVLLVGDEAIGHYWFSFYDLAHFQQSLGMWLMVNETLQAREAGKQYFYLGTCYGPASLYKANLDCLEWWTGTQWSADVRELKRLARND